MPGRDGKGPTGSEIGTLGFGHPDKGDDARLFNLTPYIPQERRFSQIERRRPELLDQILASVELFPSGGDGKRRLPEADSHVDFRDRLPWTAVRMLGRMGVSPEMLEERLYELRGRAAS